MSVKRTKVTDGLFVGKRLTFDLTKPMCGKEVELFNKTLTAMGPFERVARLEAFAAQCTADNPGVVLRVKRLRETLAQAKAQAALARLALIDAGELLRREIEALPFAQKGARFSGGKPKGAAGPMRALVRAMLAQNGNADLTARELWAACKALPERKRHGIDFESDDNAFVGGHGNVSFRRFANIVSEERKRPQ